MREIVSTITSKGQVTIPVEVRRHLKLKERDKIAFVIEPEGTVTLRAPEYPTIDSLRGIAGKLPRKVSWRKLKEMAREDALLEKHAPDHA